MLSWTMDHQVTLSAVHHAGVDNPHHPVLPEWMLYKQVVARFSRLGDFLNRMFVPFSISGCHCGSVRLHLQAIGCDTFLRSGTRRSVYVFSSRRLFTRRSTFSAQCRGGSDRHSPGLTEERLACIPHAFGVRDSFLALPRMDIFHTHYAKGPD